jgi:hypothetical protein
MAPLSALFGARVLVGIIRSKLQIPTYSKCMYGARVLSEFNPCLFPFFSKF